MNKKSSEEWVDTMWGMKRKSDLIYEYKEHGCRLCYEKGREEEKIDCLKEIKKLIHVNNYYCKKITVGEWDWYKDGVKDSLAIIKDLLPAKKKKK